MSEVLTRKEFLTKTAKISAVAVVGVTGLSVLTNKKAYGAEYTWPYQYVHVDPEEVRIKAHDLFWADKDCASGCFGAFTEVLKEKIGAPWTNIPMEVMLYGRGGGVSTWGATCGTLLGGAGIISLVVSKADSTKLINELWGWYTTEKLPTEKANNADYVDKRFTGTIVQSLSGSILCHSSLTQWCLLAKVDKGTNDRKERCGRLAGDIAAKTAEILNDYFAAKFASTWVVPASNAVCNDCHGNKVMTSMECQTCHGDDVYPHPSGIINHGDSESNEILFKQNFPNPFLSSTNLSFSIPKDGKIKLEVFDIRGHLVRNLLDSEVFSRGSYSIEWDGRDNLGEPVLNGIYFARLTSANFMKTISMNCIK